MKTTVGYTVDLTQQQLNDLVDQDREAIAEWASEEGQPNYSQFVDDLLVLEVIHELCKDFLDGILSEWSWHLAGDRIHNYNVWSILLRKVQWAARQELGPKIR